MKKAMKYIALLSVMMIMSMTVLTGCSKDKGEAQSGDVTPTPTGDGEVIDVEPTEDDLAQIKAKFISECKYVSAENMAEKRAKYENENLNISFYVEGVFEPTDLTAEKDNQYYMGYPLKEGSFRYDRADQWFLLDTKLCDIPENLTDDLVRVYGVFLGDKQVSYMTSVEKQVYVTNDGERLEVDENGIIISVTEERINKANSDIEAIVKDMAAKEELKDIADRNTKILTGDGGEDNLTKVKSDAKAILDTKPADEIKVLTEKFIKQVEELELCLKGNTENISSRKDVTVVLETNLEEVTADIPYIEVRYLDIVEGEPEVLDNTIKVSKNDIINEMFPWMNPNPTVAPSGDGKEDDNKEQGGTTTTVEDVTPIKNNNNTGSSTKAPTPTSAPATETVQETKPNGGGSSTKAPTPTSAPAPETVQETKPNGGSSTGTAGSTTVEDKQKTPSGTTQNALTLESDKTQATDKKSGKATVYYKNKNRNVDVLIGGYAMKGDNNRNAFIRGKEAKNLLEEFDYDYAEDLDPGNELAIVHFTVKINDTDAGYGSDCIPDIRIRSSRGTLIDNEPTPYYVVTLDQNGKKYGNGSSYIKEYDLVFQIPKGVNGLQVWFGSAQGKVYKWAYKGETIKGLIK